MKLNVTKKKQKDEPAMEMAGARFYPSEKKYMQDLADKLGIDLSDVLRMHYLLGKEIYHKEDYVVKNGLFEKVDPESKSHHQLAFEANMNRNEHVLKELYKLKQKFSTEVSVCTLAALEKEGFDIRYYSEFHTKDKAHPVWSTKWQTYWIYQYGLRTQDQKTYELLFRE